MLAVQPSRIAVGVAIWFAFTAETPVWAQAQSQGQPVDAQSPASDSKNDSSTPPVSEEGGALFEYLQSEVDFVELASKRAQSLYDAPADVTLISREYIESVQVDNPAELLRRAPGVMVMDTTGASYNVGLRGINRLGNNYALVMIDGRKASSFTLGYVPWGVLPLDVGDLERIEVLHGPGSTLYGADAVSGVINLVTKRPLDHRGTEGRITAGTYMVPNVDPEGGDVLEISNGGSGYAAHSFANQAGTLGARVSAGFAAAPDWDGNPEVTVPVHGDFHYHLSLTAELRKGDTSVLLNATHANVEREVSFTVAAESFSYLTSEQTVTATAKQENLFGGLGNLKVRAAMRLEETTARTFRESRGTVFELSPNTVSFYGSAQADFALWGGRNNLTVGVDAERDTIEGFQGDVSPEATYIAAVAQNELVLLEKPRLLASVGMRAERVSQSESNMEVIYRNLNPRGALVLNLDDRHAVRVVSATAYRTPSAFEVFNRAPIDDGNPSIPDPTTILPNPTLRPARSLTLELGYRGRVLEDLTVNASLFYQRVNDFIDISRALSFPITFENLFDIDSVGGSGEVVYETERLGAIWGHYTYTRTTRGDTDERIRDWPTHIGAVGARVPLPGGLRASGQLAVWSSIAPKVISVIDLVSLDLLDEKVPTQAALDLRLGRSLLDDRGELFVSVHNALGAVRDREDLRRYVSETVEPIGASVLIGLRIREGNSGGEQ